MLQGFCPGHLSVDGEVSDSVDNDASRTAADLSGGESQVQAIAEEKGSASEATRNMLMKPTRRRNMRDQERLGAGTCYVCGSPSDRERILVDVHRAAELCRVSTSTVYRWMRLKAIEWVELPRGGRLVFLDSLFRDPPRPMDAIP
jgi:hypothetical protein